MSNIRLDVVSAERVVYSDDVDLVVAPGTDGELGILPYHAPLMTTLEAGELRIKKGGEEFYLAISGGFLEVRPDRVIILADAAERVEEIDIARAEAARRRAEEQLQRQLSKAEAASVEAALRRSLTRLRVVQKRRKRRPPTAPP